MRLCARSAGNELPSISRDSWSFIQLLPLTAIIIALSRSVLSRYCACYCLLMFLLPFRLLMSITATIYISFIISTRIVIALDPNTTASGMNNTQDANLKQGWTPSPDGRGTLDILYSCGITMFLCSWSILCMNMPGPKESTILVLWRKLCLTALGVLCPELIFEFSFGQWLSARRSVRDFNSAGFGNRPAKEGWYKFRWPGKVKERWTMKEAFFTDMGGFILHTRDQLPFPLDAKQLHYLVSKRYLQMPMLHHRAIEDKNKVDGLLRAITICQITWFLVNIIGRWAQQLVVTTAELTTVSFILCSLGTAFFWWHKPADAVTAEIIESDISINDILRAEGQTFDAWIRTPLDFVNREEWWWSRSWSNFVNILHHMGLHFGSHAKPIDRIADTLQKELPRKSLYTCLGATVGYFSVLFLGWNSSFPTRTEQLLWRAACVTMMTTLIVLTIFAELGGAYPGLRQTFRQFSTSKSPQTKCIESGSQLKTASRSRNIGKRLSSAFDCVRNNSVGKDPLLYVPLRIIIPLYLVGFFYCHARTYILIADIIELRSLPASAYASVNWSKFWPHLG